VSALARNANLPECRRSTRLVKVEIVKWAKVVKDSGAKAE
jgi:hypothetical protein